MELNNEQQKAAYCTENAVIAAGAGSGKTRVLAERFVWLLTERDYKIDQILTLTFTKKAAAQMYKRIYALLQEKAENKTGIAAQRAREALDNFIKARIQTLDSYSASIVRQCAPRYGISPDFHIDQGRCRDIALELSYPFLISHRNHPAIEILYSGNGPNNIAVNIFAHFLQNYSEIDKLSGFSSDIKKQFDILCVEWEKLSSELKKMLEETENIIAKDPSLLPDLVPLMKKYKSENISIPESGEIRKYLDYLLELPPDSCIKEGESHPLQKTITALLFFLSDITGVSLQKGKRTDNQAKEKIKHLRVLFESFYSLSVSCMQAGFNISFMSLVGKLQVIYLERKRSEGVLTFKDVANLSRTILLEQHDIRNSEKEAFKAIMIDEFQDNNELQKDLLFLLAEKQEILNNGVPPPQDLSPGKLFFVGDEKQSIYLFRGADVSVFRRLKDELKSADLPLKINYRSAPVLIKAFNAIFGGSGSPSVFAQSASLPLYEAAYTPLVAGNESPGKLSFFILNKNSEDEEDDSRLSADENEACFAAEQIRKMLDEKTYQANEIAILMRTRSSQHFFEKHLRRLDIPYASEGINDLFFSGLVNDLLSVLRLAAYPHDSASYAEMLRSPFAGLSLSGTAVCLSFYCEDENRVPFDDQPLAHLDEEDSVKYINGKNVYKNICEKAEKENICSLLSELWYNEGYRYETEWNAETGVYRELFDYLFHFAVNADRENQSLASFTGFMRSFRDSGDNLSDDIEIPLERQNAIHLMTIHKSKGLEFPVVFLCGCGKKSRVDTGGIVYNSNEAGTVFSSPAPDSCRKISGKRCNFFWQKASEEARGKRTAELRRLLYVAMTRAEKELYITGCLNIKSEETDDFSLALKEYTEKKCADNENNISGDSIIDNDTFFGLMLPPVVSLLADGLFSLEEIPAYTEDYIRKQGTKKTKLVNDQGGLNEYIKNAEALYQKCEKIETPEIKNNHITPVSIKIKDDILPGRGYKINRDFSGKDAGDVFEKIDSMLERFSKINAGSFGTIAHICVEALLNKEEPVIPGNIASFLTPLQLDKFINAGKELSCRFIRSPLGEKAQDANMRESEFPFRSILKAKDGEEVFINGTVDLLFEDKNSIHIIDFKTDKNEMPGEHLAQMACYYRAVFSLFAQGTKKECRAWIYYLRTGHAVDMTERIKEFNLEQYLFE
jgi:ATP-dependent helicase/nuclease subunit A